MVTPSALDDRIRACLFGGALGDALGAAREGSKGAIELFVPPELRFTDDTQLTLATCESILEFGAVSPPSIANRFLRWFRARRITGMGAATLKSLAELDAGGHWALAGATGERAAGNGAAMRIAPLAFVLDPDVDEHRRTIADVCRITHRHDEAYLGAVAIVRTIRHAITDGGLDSSWIPALAESLPDSQLRDRLRLVSDDRLTVTSCAATFGATGFVVDSIPLAIVATLRAAEFLPAVAEIVSCGGDTDTNASLFGQMYGAAKGMGALPIQLLDRLEAAAELRETADRMARFAQTRWGR